MHQLTNTGVLGLSATPGRSYRNVDEDLELKEYYYSQKVGLKVDGEKNIIILYIMPHGYDVDVLQC